MMKSQQLSKNNKLSLDKKTIVKLDQSSLGSLNGGVAPAPTTTVTSVSVWTVIPPTVTTTV